MLSCSALKPTWQAYQNQGDGCWPRSVGSPAAVLGASAGTCYRNIYFYNGNEIVGAEDYRFEQNIEIFVQFF
jgi:hypothetical protein